MMFDIAEALYYIIPAAAILFFLISLAVYLTARHKNRRTPGTYSPEQMKTRKIWLIVSSVIAGILAVVVLAFIGLLMIAVAFM